MTYNLIFLQPDKLLLSKKYYSDWREIQSEFDTYMASLNFDTIEEVVDYLIEEYNLSRITTQKLVQGIEMKEIIELNF